MPLQKDSKDAVGEPTTKQPESDDLFSGEHDDEEELDLDDYFGDPDGEDNVTDHGTPRPAEEPPADEPVEEPADEPEVKEPAAEDATDGEPVTDPAPVVEPQEEPPAPETVKIKVQGEELELTQEELVAMAQKGEDYTRKTQALSEREKRLTGHEGLINLAQSDPKFRQYLQTYDPTTPEKAVEPEPVVDDTPPEDPVERVKWEAKREAVAEMQPTIDALRQEISTVRQSVTQVAPALKREVDPLGEVTHKAMHGYLESLPPQAAQALYQKWDTSAEAYEEGYKWMREVVQSRYDDMNAANEDPAAPAPAAEPVATAPVAKPKKVTRKTKEVAPLLESGGAAKVESTTTDKAKQVKALHNRIKNQEYDPRDVGDLFDLLDPLD